MLWISGEYLCSMVAIMDGRVSTVFGDFLSTFWLCFVGGVIGSPWPPQLCFLSSFHVTIAVQLTTAHTHATCSLHNPGIVQT